MEGVDHKEAHTFRGAGNVEVLSTLIPAVVPCTCLHVKTNRAVPLRSVYFALMYITYQLKKLMLVSPRVLPTTCHVPRVSEHTPPRMAT